MPDDRPARERLKAMLMLPYSPLQEERARVSFQRAGALLALEAAAELFGGMNPGVRPINTDAVKAAIRALAEEVRHAAK